MTTRVRPSGGDKGRVDGLRWMGARTRVGSGRSRRPVLGISGHAGTSSGG